MELLRGKAALEAAQGILAGAGLPAIEIDPGARTDPERMQLLALANADQRAVIDVRGTEGIAAVFAAAGPLGAHDAKAVHRALFAHMGVGPQRWACVRLIELLIAGGRDADPSLEGAAARLGLPAPPLADGGFDALAARAASVAAVIDAQIPQIKRDGLGRVSKLEAAAVATIAEMEHHGMRVDAERWRALTREAQHEREALRQELSHQFTGVTGSDLFGDAALNLDADADLRRALRGLGHDVPNVRRSTIALLPSPIGPPLRRYRELTKIVQAYGESFLEHVRADGRVHPTFEQIGASTGRMACHAPNLQAVVKDSGFRDCFECAADRRLVVADYATCELRILAQMSGDPVFAAAFARGDDLHATVAQSLFGKPVSKTENPELRHRTKAVNFGLVYGMGAGGLARALDTDIDSARALLARYFKTFPKIGAFLEGSAKAALQRGYAQTLAGRRLYLRADGDRNERAAAERVAKNMPIQGTSADITKLALGGLRRGLAAFDAAFVINAVHDEIVVECRAGDAEAVRDVVVAQMVAAGRELLPDIPVGVDAEIGRVWNK